MRRTTISALLGSLFLCCILVSGASAQEQETPGASREGPAVVSALQEHRYPLALEDGELSGPGADLLLREAAAVRYLLVGETHGVAEVPGVVAALFRELQDDGYRHLAVEIGPVQAEKIGEVLAGPRPMEAYRSFVGEHWPAVPFYGWREEAELLAAAVDAGGGGDVLWGPDYDILGGRYPLHRLRELAPDSAAKAAADRVIVVADSLLASALESGDLSRVMLFSRPDTVWERLREAYRPEPGSEADGILFQLSATARINEAWTSGRRWLSNQRRAALLKHNFLRQRARAAPGARVLVKTGAYHVMRGRTPTDVLDVGNLLSELSLAEAVGAWGGAEALDGGARRRAETAGSGSFHVVLLGGPGRQRTALDPKGWSVRQVPTFLSREGFWGAPLGEAVYEDRWTLIDLRPLRPLVSGGELADVGPEMERAVFAYDAAVVLAGSTGAALLDVQGTSGASRGGSGKR